MNESLKISLKKACREQAVGVIGVAGLAVLGFLADPAALAGVMKDPPKEVLLLIPVINFASKLAIDQYRHRFLPWLREWAEESDPAA